MKRPRYTEAQVKETIAYLLSRKKSTAHWEAVLRDLVNERLRRELRVAKKKEAA